MNKFWSIKPSNKDYVLMGASYVLKINCSSKTHVIILQVVRFWEAVELFGYGA